MLSTLQLIQSNPVVRYKPVFSRALSSSFSVHTLVGIMSPLLLFTLPAALTMMVFTTGKKWLIKLQVSAKEGFRQWCTVILVSLWHGRVILQKPKSWGMSNHTFPIPPGFHVHSSHGRYNSFLRQHVNEVQERTYMIRKNCLTSQPLINQISIFMPCPQVPLIMTEHLKVKAALIPNAWQCCDGKISPLLPVSSGIVFWGLWYEAICDEECTCGT